jgi:hypothetical protein
MQLQLVRAHKPNPPERPLEGTTIASHILNLETRSEELTLVDFISEIKVT